MLSTVKRHLENIPLPESDNQEYVLGGIGSASDNVACHSNLYVGVSDEYDDHMSSDVYISDEHDGNISNDTDVSDEYDIHNDDESASKSSFTLHSMLLDGHNVNDDESRLSLSEMIHKWAVDNQIKHVALKELLEVLRIFHPSLPKDPRTLLGTVTKVVTKNTAGWSYYHFGIEAGIHSKMDEFLRISQKEEVSIKINIDGLPLFKNLWNISLTFL